METSLLHDSIDVDLLTCGGEEVLGISMCAIVHSKQEYAFKYSWVRASFYGNLEHTADFITKILQNIVYQVDMNTIR